MTTQKIEGVEVFAVGQWNGREFDGDDLDEMVRAFDALKLADRIPVKLGHNADDTEPAQGWISALRRDGDRLLADLTQVPEELVDAIKDGRWRHVSIELLGDVFAHGQTYPWVPAGLAILGAARPAVDVLKPLHQLVARALPIGLRFRERLAFSRGPDDTAKLREEVARLNRELVNREFADAIKSGRILPRDQHAFEMRMGADGTLEEARRWIGATPRPAPLNRARAPEGRATDSATMSGADRPDSEVVRLAQEAIAESGGKLTYFAAQQQVLRGNPELAERYRHMPGVKE